MTLGRWKQLMMATKAITGLRDEGTKAKRLIWKVTCEDIATRRGQAQPFGTTTASAHCTYLESTQFPPAFIHHHHLHGICSSIYLLIMKNYKFQLHVFIQFIWIFGCGEKKEKKTHIHIGWKNGQNHERYDEATSRSRHILVSVSLVSACYGEWRFFYLLTENWSTNS